MFSSPVSISDLSEMSRAGPCRVVLVVDTVPWPERKPISIRLTRVTWGVSTVSIGAGRW